MKQVKGWWLPDTDTDFDRWILDGEYQKKQRDAILEFVNRNGNAIDTQIIEASTDEGTIYPYGGVRITARVLYEFTRGSA